MTKMGRMNPQMFIVAPSKESMETLRLHQSQKYREEWRASDHFLLCLAWYLKYIHNVHNVNNKWSEKDREQSITRPIMTCECRRRAPHELKPFCVHFASNSFNSVNSASSMTNCQRLG